MVAFSDDQFHEFCRLNDELEIERTAQGDLLITAPASFRTSHLKLRIAVRLGQWAERDGTGLATESSGGFILPDSAVFAPDAAWIRRDRLDAVPEEQQHQFLELTRFRGHLTLWGGGIHYAEIETAIPAGLPAPDGRVGSHRTDCGRAGS